MPARPNPVEALANLLRVADPAELRANWRQAIAALGQRGALGLATAPPLEGMSEDVLTRAAQIALAQGLVDDLDWIAQGPAAVALYEITAALPAGTARRELARRVFARLYRGTAATFATVAARMALTSTRQLEPATLKARVGLLFDLPVGTSANPDPLALALVTRRELRERWIDQNATGTLHARRLAAKIIEHAAREAVQRFQQGDTQPRELLLGEPLRTRTLALLADREPLVWRHIAVARGLLAGIDEHVRDDIELSLNPALGPTEWRRGAVSLVALMVSDPEYALRACRTVLDGPVGQQDRGTSAALVMGLPRVIEAEPDAAEQLLDWLADTGRLDVADAVANLLADVQRPSFGERAALRLREALSSRNEHASPLLRELAARSLKRLARDGQDGDAVALVRRALLAYEQRGAREAVELATLAAMALAREMDLLAISDARGASQLPRVLATLEDIDAAALERPRLRDLLLLGRRPGDNDAAVPELDAVYDRLGRWILHAERAHPAAASTPVDALAEQRQLRALLHLMDVGAAHEEADENVKLRVSRTLSLLSDRVGSSGGLLTERIIAATLARACDAAVREGIAEPADCLLLLWRSVGGSAAYRSIGEACTNPDVRGVILAYSEFSGAGAHGPESVRNAEPRVAATPPAWLRADDPLGVAERVIELSRGLGGGGSYRGEALRRIVLRLGRALEVIARAHSQSELGASDEAGLDPLHDLEAAIEDLDRLARGARRRLIAEDPSEIAVTTDVPSVSSVLERAAQTHSPVNAEQFELALRTLTAMAPFPIADAVGAVLSRVAMLPVHADSDVFAIPLERRRAELPDWLLPHRTIGAFQVTRSLGSGGASSVFVARRIEERNQRDAEEFALKVPDYDPTTARSLSEQEFLQLFREEAGALLALPEHENLARFVTFDAGARPKPILVMELIRGTSLDRLIRARALNTERALAHLDGILAGLEAMHGAGVGHLDVKPSNVILRDGATPVLVDFGLSGRHLRPGCGSIDYSAPEVLGVFPDGFVPSPLPTDVYAFGCLAFEVLTANFLFDGADETEVLNGHLSHDGWPARLLPFAHARDTAELAKLFAACLRRDPRLRPTATQARAALARLLPAVQRLSWPLGGDLAARRAAS